MALLSTAVLEPRKYHGARTHAPIRLAIVQSLFSSEQKPLFDRINRHTEIALRLFTLKANQVGEDIWREDVRHTQFGNGFPSSHRRLRAGNSQYEYQDPENFIFAPSLSFRLAMWSPDVVICEGFTELLNVLPSEFLNCLRIVTGVSQAPRTNSDAPAWKQYLTNFMYRTADAYIAAGSTSAMYLRTIGVETSQIFSTISTENNASHSRRDGTAISHTPEKIYSWLSVGEIGSDSGYPSLIRAWGAQPDDFRHKNRLLIVGEGSKESALRRAIRDQGLEGDIKLDRFPTSEQLNRLYAQSDVFVYPGREPHWNSWIGEAVTVGLPILCACYPDYLSGLARKLDHLPFNPRNVEAFDRAISNFWQRRDQWHTMGNLSTEWLSDNKEQITADTLINAALHAVGRVARAD